MEDIDEIENILQEDNRKETKDLDVLKELFKLKDIETKTELSINQVILINQKRMIAKLLNWKTLNESLNDFMLLMVSNQRKGRSEFVDGFKGEREHALKSSGSGFFSNLGNKLLGR